MNSISKRTARRSPIKGPIARQPGQGLNEYLVSFSNEEILRAVLPVGFVIWWFSIELIHRYTQRSTPLWLLGLLFVATLLFSIMRIRRCWNTMRKIQRGIDGERYVAQIIERDLIPSGYRALHDLPFEKDGRKFNIDHLLIGPNGVFCIETKTWSKPFRGETIATYDGSEILLNGVSRCGNAVGQARALAKFAEEQIKKLTGISVKVHSFVVCVGWFVRRTCAEPPDVLVVNEEALSAFVKACRGTLDNADLDQIWNRLKDAFS